MHQAETVSGELMHLDETSIHPFIHFLYAYTVQCAGLQEARYISQHTLGERQCAEQTLLYKANI